MTIQGSELEPQNQPPTNDADLPNPPATEPDDDDLIPVEKNAKGEDVVPRSALVSYRKQAKETQRQLQELQPKIQQAQQIAQNLEQIQPYIEILKGLSPEQRAALQAGTLQGPTPEPQEDTEARQVAEDLGLITMDGKLDLAKARRHIDYMDRKARQLAQQAVAPFATMTQAQQAAVLREQAVNARGPNGRPFASAESIREAYAELPVELASNPHVMRVVLGTAKILDEQKGRVAAAPTYDEPLFTEPAGGGRRGAVMTDDDREIAKRVGVDEKTYQQSIAQLGQMTRRGLALE